MSNIESATSYITKGTGYFLNQTVVTENYAEQIDKNREKQEQLRKSIDEMKWALEQSVNEGTIVFDSEEYRNAQKQILELETEIISCKDENLELLSSMANIPNQIIEEKLGRLEQGFKNITTAMSAGVAESEAVVRAFEKITGGTFMNEYDDPFFLMNQGQEDFRYQNRLLGSETLKASEEAKIAAGEYQKAVQAYKDAYANGALSSEEVEVYRQARDTAFNTYIEKAAEAASKEVNNWKQAIANIDAYYKNMNLELDANIKKLQTINDSIKDLRDTTKSVGEYSDNLAQIISYMGRQYENLALDANSMERELEEGVKAGTIKIGDSVYKQLNADIINLRTELISLRNTQKEYFRELVNMPMTEAEKDIDNLTADFDILRTSINKGLTDSITAIRTMDKWNSMLGNNTIFNGTNSLLRNQIGNIDQAGFSGRDFSLIELFSKNKTAVIGLEDEFDSLKEKYEGLQKAELIYSEMMKDNRFTDE